MIYVNNNADVFLPSPTGKGDVKIPAGTPTARPSGEPWLTSTNLNRSYVGVAFSIAPADPAVVDLGSAIVVNGYTANAEDDANHSATGVLTPSSAYTIFGKVTWTDANGTWTAQFSATGDGTHGSGSTFVVENIGGAATKPVATGSIISAKKGTLSLQFNNGQPDSTQDFRLFFEPIFVSPSFYFTETSEDLPAAPDKRTKMTLVQPGDVGTSDYVTGSAGLVKTVREFAHGARVGDPCQETIMKYQDATYPTKPTDITLIKTTVSDSDLA